MVFYRNSIHKVIPQILVKLLMFSALSSIYTQRTQLQIETIYYSSFRIFNNNKTIYMYVYSAHIHTYIRTYTYVDESSQTYYQSSEDRNQETWTRPYYTPSGWFFCARARNNLVGYFTSECLLDMYFYVYVYISIIWRGYE